jgi:hypothetical protein
LAKVIQNLLWGTIARTRQRFGNNRCRLSVHVSRLPIPERPRRSPFYLDEALMQPFAGVSSGSWAANYNGSLHASSPDL